MKKITSLLCALLLVCSLNASTRVSQETVEIPVDRYNAFIMNVSTVLSISN